MDDDRRESGMDTAFVAVEGAARIDEAALALEAPARAKRRGAARSARVAPPAEVAALGVEVAPEPQAEPVARAEEPVVKSKRKARRAAALPEAAAEERGAEAAASAPQEVASSAAESAAVASIAADAGAVEPMASEASDGPTGNDSTVNAPTVNAPTVNGQAAEPWATHAAAVPDASGAAESAPIEAGEAPSTSRAKKKRGRKADRAADAAEAQQGEAAPQPAAELVPSAPAVVSEEAPADEALASAGASAEAEAETGADAPAATAGGELDLPTEETGLERIEDRQLLAVLFGSPEELTVPRLAEILGWKRRAVEQRLPRVRAWLDKLVMPFELRLIAGGWRLVSRSEYAELLGRLRVVRRRDRLSQAALEVLSVVAYKQPVPASEVDRIRGVNCSSILRLLLDRELVHVVGRQDSPGRPLLYGTTKLFLDRFGLGALHDLPGIEVAHDGYAAADDIAPDELPSAEDGAAPISAEPPADDEASAPASEPSA